MSALPGRPNQQPRITPAFTNAQREIAKFLIVRRSQLFGWAPLPRGHDTDHVPVRAGRKARYGFGFADASRDSDGISGFLYQAHDPFLLIHGSDGPDSPPFFAVRSVSAIFGFGPGAPHLSDFRTVLDKMIERADELAR